MTPPAVLGVLLALAAFALAVSAGWLVAALAGLALDRIRQAPAAARATLLAQARLMPLACAAVLVPAQMLAFARFEAGRAESAGPLLIGAAVAGLALVLDAITSGIASWRHTRVIVATWRDSATPLKLPLWTRCAWSIRRRFPVVAVVGVVHPQLYIASQVARDCTAEELAAIAAHEAAHVRARDNLLRLLYRVTPGARLAGRIADRLEREWMAAAEEAADADARRATSALELASALTKVARMAAACPHEAMPASALIGGHALELRVRRLLEAPTTSRRPVVSWIPAAVLIVGSFLVASAPALASLHELFELLVRH